MISMCPPKQKRFPESGYSPGTVFARTGLLSLAVPAKPLADIVASYTCSNRHQEVQDDIHDAHPLPAASLGGTAQPVYQYPTENARYKRDRHLSGHLERCLSLCCTQIGHTLSINKPLRLKHPEKWESLPKRLNKTATGDAHCSIMLYAKP